LFHSGHYSHFVVLIYFDASNGLQADFLHYSYNKKPNRRNKVNVFSTSSFSSNRPPPVWYITYTSRPSFRVYPISTSKIFPSGLMNLFDQHQFARVSPVTSSVVRNGLDGIKVHPAAQAGCIKRSRIGAGILTCAHQCCHALPDQVPDG
jgi:hypothetical protein